MAYVNNKEVAPSGDNIKMYSQQNVANSVAQYKLTESNLTMPPALGSLLNGAKNSVNLTSGDEVQHLDKTAQGEDDLAEAISDLLKGEDNTITSPSGDPKKAKASRPAEDEEEDTVKSSMPVLRDIMAPAFTAGAPLQPNTVAEVGKTFSRPMIPSKYSKGPVEVSISTELVREAGSSVQQLEKIEGGSLKLVEPNAKYSAQPTTPKQQEVTAYGGEWWHRLDKNPAVEQPEGEATPKPRRKAAKPILYYKEPTLSQKLRSGDTFFPCQE